MVRLMLWCCMAVNVLAGSAKPAVIELPEKYTPDHYANLQPFERDRCDRYVNELRLMAKREHMGGRPGDADKMKARTEQIDKDYNKYCLKQL
ncbi:MAG: hypothetical protein JO142_11835 [Burkholderiales bacterium]|nr:hypothetical protein [Burkholderiales bacterium]